MKALFEPRVLNGGRYFAVDLEGRGLHHFQRPVYSDAYALIGLAKAESSWADHLLLAGVLIGVCWHHQGYVLETEVPDLDDQAVLRKFSRAVQRELMDEEYTRDQVMELSTGVIQELVAFAEEADPAATEAVLGNGDAAQGAEQTSG